MSTATNTQIVVVGGISIQSTQTRTATGQIAHEVPLPAGKARTLTTRTDADTGVATLSNGHLLTTGMKVDVYWAAGCRHGMEATVSSNAVTIEGGAGDDLPQGTTPAVVLTQQVVIDTDLDGDLIEIIAVMNTQTGHVDFQKEAGTSILARPLVASELWAWVADTGAANPLTGDPIAKIAASNGSSTVASTLKIGILYGST